jgi:peptidoglycan/LPS O-acetylase OafA/YrhL
LPCSFLAVDLFFLLSGFVLASAYEKRFQRGMTAAAFLRIRLIRLYPLYILGTLMGVLVALLAMKFGGAGLSVNWTPSLFAESLPFSVAMLPSPKSGSTDALYPFNPVLWSIFVELFINCVYVLCWRLFCNAKHLAAVVGLSGVALACYGLRIGNLDGGGEWYNFLDGVVRVVFSFLFGVLIFHRWGGRRRRESNLALSVIFILPLIFLAPQNVAFELIAILVLFPIIVGLSSAYEPAPRFQRLFTLLGVTSYALYTIHKPLYQLLLGMLKRILSFPPESLAPWIGILYIPVLIGICLVVDQVYDLPLRQRLSRKRHVSLIERQGARKEEIAG